MADFDSQERAMLARWYGTPDLVHNEAFWQDCLKTYRGKLVTLPYDDTPEQRHEIAPLLQCLPEECGICRGSTIPITAEDYNRMSANIRKRIDWKTGPQGNRFLDATPGCQFLKNGACTIYNNRPAYCKSFPVVEPRATVSPDGMVFRQLQVKLNCRHALEAIRLLMARACAGRKLMLLPDLSIIPTYENTGSMFTLPEQEMQNVSK